MKSNLGFYSVLCLICIGIMIFVIEGIDNKDALSWAEVLIVIGYIVTERTKLRFWMVKKWPYLENKPSAPYIIGFMMLLTLAACLLMLRLEPIAEEMANIAYFLLMVGVGIELYQLKKTLKKESG